VNHISATRMTVKKQHFHCVNAHVDTHTCMREQLLFSKVHIVVLNSLLLGSHPEQAQKYCHLSQLTDQYTTKKEYFQRWLQ